MKSLKRNKVGLALGGGAVLGAAHIGVLRALDEFDVQVSCVAGTSIGAFIAAFFGFGKSWQEIQEIATDIDWLDVSRISLSQFGLLSNKKLGELIVEHIGEKTFKESEIPIAMVATDITSGERVVLDSGDVATAVMASTCIPGIFNPIEIENRLLVDGGIVENVPVHPLRDMGADFSIGVALNAIHSHKKPENIIEVLLNSFDFTIRTATKLQTSDADILINPDLSNFNMVDSDQAEALINKGYDEAKEKLKAL